MWKEITSSSFRTYQLNDEPELIHIIEGGHEDSYFVVQENAYEDYYHGKTSILSAADILRIYNIDLKISRQGQIIKKLLSEPISLCIFHGNPFH